MICTFVETSIFSKKVDSLKDGESVKKLIQNELLNDPDKGDLIKDTGGLRKLRIKKSDRGKSGSYRIVYFHLNARNQIFLIDLYEKGQKEDLTEAEKKIIRSLIKKLKD